ncbi:hypothetical protein TWF703_008636 [Orbilia oligospora]|uniref:Uncharacterized protein n=1 Tax=Orbilia oligospora TaxID=2813651 RepID=A0A7C8P2T8_ORBOL|nr:hypothetical protein TWF703_008636 [Orbilia oligospora]
MDHHDITFTGAPRTSQRKTNKMKVFNVIVLAFVATVVASPAPEPMGEPGSVAELHKRQCSSCRNGQYSCVCGPGQWCWYKC